MMSNVVRYRRYVTLGAILGACGCGNPVGAIGDSWMEAAVLEAADPAEEVEYTGTANFGRTGEFSVSSRGNGDSEDQTVVLLRGVEGRPGRGSYAMKAFGSQGDDFGALYRRVLSDGTVERFSAVPGGSVRVTESGENRVEGTFEFTGQLFCTTPPGEAQGDSCDPSRPIGGSAQVIVTGSFAATPYGPFCPSSLGRSCS